MSDKKKTNSKEKEKPPRTTNPNTTGEVRAQVEKPNTGASPKSVNKEKPKEKSKE